MDYKITKNDIMQEAQTINFEDETPLEFTEPTYFSDMSKKTKDSLIKILKKLDRDQLNEYFDTNKDSKKINIDDERVEKLSDYGFTNFITEKKIRQAQLNIKKRIEKQNNMLKDEEINNLEKELNER